MDDKKRKAEGVRIREQLSAISSKIDWTLIATLLVMFLGYMLFHDLIGATLLSHNDYDSYSLQAEAWLQGRVTVSPDHTWLELAFYNGEAYVSFPPVPSLVMLPLVVLCGGAEGVPSNLVAMVVAMLCLTFCYRCFRHQGHKPRTAMLWAIFYVLGTTMLWLSTHGGVWFIAQGLNLMFCTAAIWAWLNGRNCLAMALAALAVGCRPFDLFFVLALLLIIFHQYWQEYPNNHGRAVALTARTLIVPAIVAVWLMWYNWIRFADPFEFGHNYLPEFVNAEEGQFSATYLYENAKSVFTEWVRIGPDLGLTYPRFNGIVFFVANPIFIVYFVMLVIDIVKKRICLTEVVMSIGLALNLLLLMVHKTFGGWQFGSRYTVDLLPYVLACFMRSKTRMPKSTLMLPIVVAAVLFNMYGALAMHFKEGIA